VRLLTWNVHDLMGDPLAVHRVIRAASADLACLQEAPRRPGARLRLRVLERATGLRCVAGGRRAGGTAILVGPAVRVGWVGGLRLPVPRWWDRTRGACVAVCRDPGTVGVTGAGAAGFVVASVHLPLDPALRLDHAARVATLVQQVGRRHGLPVVVAGDLNEPPGAPAWRAWAPVATDPWPDAGPTYPAGDPVHRLDAVLVGPGVRATPVADGWCHEDDVRRASDHRPVLARLTLTG